MTSYLSALLLLIYAISSPYTHASATSEQPSELQFAMNPDGTFNVITLSTQLEEILNKIGETINVEIHVDSESRKRIVTINQKSITLMQLLQRITDGNYVVIYDKKIMAQRGIVWVIFA